MRVGFFTLALVLSLGSVTFADSRKAKASLEGLAVSFEGGLVVLASLGVLALAVERLGLVGGRGQRDQQGCQQCRQAEYASHGAP